MIFNSISFIIFLLILFIAYYSTGSKYRWIVLLVASFVFLTYANIIYIVPIFLSTVSSYFIGIAISRTDHPKKKKSLLAMNVLINVTMLISLKYVAVGSLLDDIVGVRTFSASSTIGSVIFLGISFYTLQAIGYTIDTYYGRLKPEKNFGIFALYISFFPKLTAGPIERAKNLIPQLHKQIRFNYQDVRTGLQRILWGLFKKIVIADRLALIVDNVYKTPESFQGINLLIAVFFFSIQIYVDFSAYTDIALGTAKVFGYNLSENFQFPYFAASIREFWQRWHISLTSWFRDYLYLPLGGNRVTAVRWYFNIMIIFLVSGLWHGSGFTFLIWGGLHGALYLGSDRLGKLIGKFVPNMQKESAIFYYFCVLSTFSLVTFAWIFFRANSIEQAFYIIQHMFDGTGTFLLNIDNIGYIRSVIGQLGVTQQDMYIIVCGVMLIFLIEYFQYRKPLLASIDRYPLYVRWSIYYALTVSIMFFGAFNSAQQFIYQQF